MVNLDLWKKIGPADQALFEMACTAAAMRAITTGEFLQGKQIAICFPCKNSPVVIALIAAAVQAISNNAWSAGPIFFHKSKLTMK